MAKAKPPVKVSKVSKLDNILSWSLMANETCPGARNKDGSLVDACKGCYADNRGNYRYPNVKAPRQFNRKDWKREGWVDDMVAVLKNQGYFRWFDSGDAYCSGLVSKIKEVIERTPWTIHWLPTRMYKFPKIRVLLEEIKQLPNASVRYSSDAIDGTYTDGLHGSTIVPSVDSEADGVSICSAPKTDGKCASCRKCWDKNVPVIGYVAHGATMLKQIRVKLEQV